MQLLRQLQAAQPAAAQGGAIRPGRALPPGPGNRVHRAILRRRDSCYALHLIVNELGLRPVTYTYDWGMVTDLGRRNISRMCSELGVENIIVADDITKKRKYIQMNLHAWLRSPHLGMVSILTAGDKHFFRHIETMKHQTGVDLNLWGINPLEVTHFKAGFLGVPPDFEEERVYTHGAMKQLRYQSLRLRAMTQSPGYFNRSVWDTLSGEYYRSFMSKSDYFHVFDYWRWDEQLSTAPSTSTTGSGPRTPQPPGGSVMARLRSTTTCTTRSPASRSTTPSAATRSGRARSRGRKPFNW